MALALRWTGPGDPPLALLNRLGERLETRLANLPGTKETEIYGEPEEELRVLLSPARVAAAGLSAETVATALLPSRYPGQRGGAYKLRSRTFWWKLAGSSIPSPGWRRCPHCSADGGQLKVGDLAEVRRAVIDPRRPWPWPRGSAWWWSRQ